MKFENRHDINNIPGIPPIVLDGQDINHTSVIPPHTLDDLGSDSSDSSV